MADVAVETVLRFPPVSLGVGESAVTRSVVRVPFRIERLSIVLPWSRLSGLLHANDVRHLDVVSVKVDGAEQLDLPLPSELFLPELGPVRRPFSKRTVMPGDVIT